jgi:hypothetical protein
MTVQAQTTTRNQNINHRNFPRGEGAQKGYPYQPQIGAALAAWAAHIEMITGEKPATPDRLVKLRA